MRIAIAAALALAASSINAQSVTDLSTATPIPGDWSYATARDGSEAKFIGATGNPQLWVHCTRATRRVTIAKPAAAAAPFNVWTSSATRTVPANFNPATARLTIDLAAWDPLLDAMATSRGRFAVSLGTQPALVIPAWPETARVIEDCRA